MLINLLEFKSLKECRKTELMCSQFSLLVSLTSHQMLTRKIQIIIDGFKWLEIL